MQRRDPECRQSPWRQRGLDPSIHLTVFTREPRAGFGVALLVRCPEGRWRPPTAQKSHDRRIVGSGTHRVRTGSRRCGGLVERGLAQTINFARISLIVGQVFLHYESFPNARISPFRGVDPQQNQVATYLQSFVLFFFFSVVPLLSMISGWLFFSFRDDAGTALRSRIRRRFVSLYLPLIFWNALFLAALLLLFHADPAHQLLAELNIDFAAAA